MLLLAAPLARAAPVLVDREVGGAGVLCGSATDNCELGLGGVICQRT